MTGTNHVAVLAHVRALAAELGEAEWRAEEVRGRFYAAVLEAVDTGATMTDVAAEAGLSRQRVKQIVDPQAWKEWRDRERAKRGREREAWEDSVPRP